MTTGGLGVKDVAARRGRTAIARSRGQSYGPALFEWAGPSAGPETRIENPGGNVC